MNDDLDDINDLVKELKETKNLIGLTPPVDEPTITPKVTNDSIEDFVLEKSAKLIQQGVDTIERVKNTISSGAPAEEVEAYSKLISSVASAIEILNKIHLQNKKTTATKEIKQMEMEASKKLLDKYGGDKHNTIENQTNILVTATREEIMKALASQAMQIKDIDANFNIKEEKEH